MSRRPLGAHLPPDDRLVALEQRIRDYRAAVDALEVAWSEVHTGHDVEGRPVALGHAQAAAWRAFVELQELNASPIRGRETVTRSTTAGVAG